MKNARILVWVGVLALAAAAAGQQSSAAVATPAEPQLVILDTDIGDDIDDAFALALALRSPELKILGITTAYGIRTCGPSWWSGFWVHWQSAF